MSQSTVEILRKNFSGDIIELGDSQYEQASTTFATKGAPALIVRPRSAAEVALAIQYAADHSLLISVRSGGHSGAGFGTNNGGLVIDLVHLHKIEVVDRQKGLVRLGGGAKWGDVAQELQKHHLAISSGDTKSVGVGGLTLGGGVGWMIRKYGLAIDSLVGAEVVTADGRILRVNETEYSDLFWAIRGGGGNFGVVTSFDFAAHTSGNVYAGNITYPQENLAGLLKGWRDCMRAAPEELTTTFVALPSFGGNPPAAMIMCCYAGDDKAAARHAIDPLLQLGKVLRQDVEEKDYADVLEEVHAPGGVKAIVNNVFIQEFSDALIDTLSRQTGQILQIRSVGGAMNRVAADATAFAHRDSEVLIVSPVFIAPDATAAAIDTALKPWRDTRAYGRGAYINFFAKATAEEVAAAYPKATYDRLSKIKKIYDPHNIFNQNFNIKPA